MKDLTLDYQIMALFLFVFFIVMYLVIGGIVLSLVIMPYENEEDAKARLWLISPSLCFLFQVVTFGALLYVRWSIAHGLDQDEDEY